MADKSWRWYLFGEKEDHASQKNRSADNSNNPSSDMEKAAGHLFKTVPTQPHTNNEKHKAAERYYWRRQIRVGICLNWITGIAAAVALAGFGAVIISIRHADDATIEANRAWIAVENAGWIQSPPNKGGDPYGIAISYENLGHDPALNVKKFQDAFWIDGLSQPTDILPAGSLHFETNNTCEKVESDSGIGVIWPTGKDIRPGTSRDRIGVRYAPDDLFSKRKLLGYHGCFVYQTFGKERRTGFCFFLVPSFGPISAWVWSICPGQNQNFAN